MGVILQRFEHRAFAFLRGNDGIKRFIFVLKYKFIDVEAGDHRPLDAIQGSPMFLPGFHVLAVLVPKIFWQLAHAGVEQIGILQNLVIKIIFRRHPNRARLDAHIDVFGHQHHTAFGVVMLQVERDR